MSNDTDRTELLTALRQFRHNTDNSPDLNNPKQGFAFGYDCLRVENLVERLIEERDEHKNLANVWYERWENEYNANRERNTNRQPKDFADFVQDLQALRKQWLNKREENIVSPSTGRWMLDECIKDIDHILRKYL